MTDNKNKPIVQKIKAPLWIRKLQYKKLPITYILALTTLLIVIAAVIISQQTQLKFPFGLADDIDLSFGPDNVTVNHPDTFAIDLFADATGVEFAAANVIISYDPGLVEFSNIILQPNLQLLSSEPLNQGRQRVILAVTCNTQTSCQTFAGTQKIATLNFNTVGPGSGIISVDSQTTISAAENNGPNRLGVAGLATITVNDTTPPGGGGIPSSIYEIQLETPDCDATNPSVRFITTNNDWQDINNSTYQTFCVHPGDYTSAGNINLDAKGSSLAKRWIRYYDPANPTDDRHPVDRSSGEQAIIRSFTFNNADHWVIQGLTQQSDSSDHTEIRSDSQHNIFDHMLVESGSYYGQIVLRHSAHNNTIQNSVLRNTQIAPNADRGCILLFGNNSGSPTDIHNTRIVNNEIYNCTDSVALSRPSNFSIPIDYSGTIIDQNDMYITSALYADGNGNLNPQGDYSCAENAIDVKAGGTSGGHVQITNNRMWGFRQTDDACGGSGSHGDIITVHQGAQYVLIRGNQMWDASKGPSLSDDGVHDGHGWDTGFVSVVDNVVYKISNPNTSQDIGVRAESVNSEIYRNIVVDATDWTRTGGNNNDLRCNVLINGQRQGSSGSNTTADYNFYYNAEQLALPGTNDIVSAQASDANHADLIFQARRWTGLEEVTIPHGTATASSPHAGACDPNLGSRPGIGIDDQPPPGGGTTYYVDPNGSDSNPGTSSQPWKTLQKAANTVQAGVTVMVQAGTYTDDFTIDASGISGSPITFDGEGANTKLVTDKSQNNASVMIDADYIVFKDFDVEGNIHVNGHNNLVENNYVHDSWEDAGIYLFSNIDRDGNDTTYNTVRNNTVAYAIKAGIYIEGQNNLIEGNDISHTQDHSPDGSNQTDADGMRFFGGNHLIKGNYIHDVWQTEAIGAPHIDMIQSWQGAYNIVFDGNVMHNPNPTGSNRILMLSRHPGSAPVDNLVWVNNVFIFSDDTSAAMFFNREDGMPEITNMVVVNNVFYSPNGLIEKAAAFDNITGVTFKNNLVINTGKNSFPYVVFKGGTSGVDVGYNAIYNTDGSEPDDGPYPNDIWMVDPQVVDMTGSNIDELDFHLTASSPLINAGVDNNFTDHDYDGIPRPQGGAFDIGAYEYSN